MMKYVPIMISVWHVFDNAREMNDKQVDNDDDLDGYTMWDGTGAYG